MRAIPAILAGAVALAAGPALADEAQTVKVSLSEWSLGFQEVSVAGKAARFEVTNDGTTPHAFELEGRIGGEAFEVVTPRLDPGQTTTLILELPPGTYEVYCPVPGHEEKGMAGTVTFEGEA